MDTNDRLTIAGREFKSRLWVGTGKYKDFIETKKAIDASGADVVTVAVRRVNITDRSKENLLDYLDPKRYVILSGAHRSRQDPDQGRLYRPALHERRPRCRQEAGGYRLSRRDAPGGTDRVRSRDS